MVFSPLIYNVNDIVRLLMTELRLNLLLTLGQLLSSKCSCDSNGKLSLSYFSEDAALFPAITLPLSARPSGPVSSLSKLHAHSLIHHWAIIC